jgi:DNA-3-methyladenine glycosylase II
MQIPVEHAKKATRHLKRSDPVMRELIGHVGPFQLRLERNRFWVLARSIISQQVSATAARAIRARVQSLFESGIVSADRLLDLSENQLRSAGLSAPKVSYLFDLADAVLKGRVRLRRIARKPDEEIIQELTQVKGIGRWTAQMFLIFSLGRLNVFPADDLAVRTAIRNLYNLTNLPDSKTSHKIAQAWRPYATVASWYCWRSIALQRAGIPVPNIRK